MEHKLGSGKVLVSLEWVSSGAAGSARLFGFLRGYLKIPCVLPIKFDVKDFENASHRNGQNHAADAELSSDDQGEHDRQWVQGRLFTDNERLEDESID